MLTYMKTKRSNTSKVLKELNNDNTLLDQLTKKAKVQNKILKLLIEEIKKSAHKQK